MLDPKALTWPPVHGTRASVSTQPVPHTGELRPTFSRSRPQENAKTPPDGHGGDEGEAPAPRYRSAPRPQTLHASRSSLMLHTFTSPSLLLSNAHGRCPPLPGASANPPIALAAAAPPPAAPPFPAVPSPVCCAAPSARCMELSALRLSSYFAQTASNGALTMVVAAGVSEPHSVHRPLAAARHLRQKVWPQGTSVTGCCAGGMCRVGGTGQGRVRSLPRMEGV